MPSANRTTQFLFRLSPEERETWEKAARLEKMGLSAFIRTAAGEKARRVLGEPKGQPEPAREP